MGVGIYGGVNTLFPALHSAGRCQRRFASDVRSDSLGDVAATVVPERILEFFAADPFGPSYSVRRHADDKSSPIQPHLDDFLSAITQADAIAVLDDDQFQFFNAGVEDLDRAARLWIAERFIDREICRQRLLTLRENANQPRPRPYELRPLADLPVDADGLVSLSHFSFDGSRLLRRGHAFLPLSTTGAANSTYWLLNVIYEEGLADVTQVRLDPFLTGPDESFPAVSYKMLVYGRPLDWERLESLKEPDHGRWTPNSLSHGQFTDYAWVPRDGKVHFVCEEVPKTTSEASRYLHAICKVESRQVAHLDGALRVYSPDELRSRLAQHVRNAGKVGERHKVFRIDTTIKRDSLSAVAQAFFIWNYDVHDYFCPRSQARLVPGLAADPPRA